MKTSRLKRGIAGIAAAALAVTGATLAAAPASADNVSATQLGSSGDAYKGWNEGFANPVTPAVSNWDGIFIGDGGPNQILNGLVLAGEPGLETTGTALGAMIEGSLLGVVSGEAFLQVAVTWEGGWSTLRPATPVSGGDTSAFAVGDDWESSKDVGAIPANTPTALSEILAVLDENPTVRYSGFGFFASTPTTVQWMLWNGASEDGGSYYNFARPYNYIEETSVVNVTLGEIRENEDTYTGWHEGYENETPAFTVTEEGLNLGLGANSQIINGFAEPLTDIDLFSLFTSVDLNVVSGAVSFQVPLFFGGGDVDTFTTLRPADFATAGENYWSLDSLWTTSKAIGSIEANESVRLGDLLTALENAGNVRILGVGVLASEGTPGVVESFLFNGVRYNFATPAEVPGAVTPKPELAATGFDGTAGLGLAGLALMLGLGLAGSQLVRSRRSAPAAK